MKDVDTHVEMLPYATRKPDIVGVEKDGDTENTLYRVAAKELHVVKAMGMGRSISTELLSFGRATLSKLHSSDCE